MMDYQEFRAESHRVKTRKGVRTLTALRAWLTGPDKPQRFQASDAIDAILCELGAVDNWLVFNCLEFLEDQGEIVCVRQDEEDRPQARIWQA
jgi:hypothetical protein